MKILIKRRIKRVLVALLVSMLAACFKGEMSVEEVISTELTGTVATSKALVATITIVDSDGKIHTVKSDSAGEYAIEMSTAKGPFLIKAEPDDTEQPTLYSFSTGVGVANLTHFTSLALLLAKDVDLALTFDDWSNTSPKWTLQSINDELAIINSNFNEALAVNGFDPSSYNMLSAAFKMNTTGMGRFLADYAVDINYIDRTYVITSAISGTADNSVSLDEQIDTTDYFIGYQLAFDENATWLVTKQRSINGVAEQKQNNFAVDVQTVPFSRSSFIETGWVLIEDTVNASNPTGELSVQLLDYSPSYSVNGSGSVGSVVSASLLLSYRVSGTVDGEAVDETLIYEWQWTYKRST